MAWVRRISRLSSPLFRLAHLGRRMYWRLLKPVTLGSRCIVLRDGEVLLVKHVYEPWWYLPGGGVKRTESFSDAARREVREEAGVSVEGLRLLGLYHNRVEGKSDHVAVFVAQRFTGTPGARSPEIEEVRFAPLGDLPEDTSPSTRRRLEEYAAGEGGGRW